MRVKTVTIATYNQNCLRAGEICRDEDMIDTVIEGADVTEILRLRWVR